MVQQKDREIESLKKKSSISQSQRIEADHNVRVAEQQERKLPKSSKNGKMELDF